MNAPRRAAIALTLLLAAGAAAAQSRPAPSPGKPDAAAPAPESAPPYEPQLLALAEIMGSLAYLRTLCAGTDAADWPARMTALLDAEGRTPVRRERLTSAYNRGFRAYAPAHRSCGDGTREAARRLAAEGDRLSRTLAGRYGG